MVTGPFPDPFRYGGADDAIPSVAPRDRSA